MNFMVSPSRKLWSCPSTRLRSSNSFAVSHDILGTLQNETRPVSSAIMLDSSSAYRPEDTMAIIAAY
jgi:hypothetical protein